MFFCFVGSALFDEMNITEIIDSEDDGVRYMLCKNENERVKEAKTRENIIRKVEELLTQKAAVKQKRKKEKVCAGIGRIFAKYRIEKFFFWDVDDEGKLTWGKKEDKIKEESELDGCYVIRGDVSADKMNKEKVVETYRDLQKVEQAFKNLKTVALEMRPVYHKLDERIEAHIFISMLAYYLQWHIIKRTEILFKEDGKGEERRWSYDIIIERLKSIRKTEILLNDIPVKKEVSKPDKEQKKILELLNIKLM